MSSRASIAASAVEALAAVVRSPATVVTATVVIVSVSPLLAPTWKVCGPAPAPTMAAPLKRVWVAIRVISAESCWYSVSRLERSPVPLVPFCACTASSRMRCSASVTVASAPSAVCASEMPSLALRIATLVPRICAFIRSAIARPAASSFGGVDAQARGQPLHRGRQRRLRRVQVPLRVQRRDVGVDRLGHGALRREGWRHSFPGPSASIAESEALLAANSRPETKKPPRRAA